MDTNRKSTLANSLQITPIKQIKNSSILSSSSTTFMPLKNFSIKKHSLPKILTYESLDSKDFDDKDQKSDGKSLLIPTKKSVNFSKNFRQSKYKLKDFQFTDRSFSIQHQSKTGKENNRKATQKHPRSRVQTQENMPEGEYHQSNNKKKTSKDNCENLNTLFSYHETQNKTTKRQSKILFNPLLWKNRDYGIILRKRVKNSLQSKQHQNIAQLCQ